MDGATVPAFNFTTLLPTAPKIMLNVVVEDYGIVEDRRCGCPLEAVGFTAHLCQIHSFKKLTGEGVTLIVRRIGGLGESVEDSGGGFVYDDERSLMGAMEQLLANPELRRDLGRRGHQAYLSTWTPQAHLERYLEIIGAIAATRNGGSRGTRTIGVQVST